MQLHRIGICLVLGLATMLPVAAADPEVRAAASLPNGVQAVGPDPAPDNAKKPRLKFKTADGVCACTCASGGKSEADIRKAQEARELASNK